MHQNSISAYVELQETLQAREKDVLAVYVAQGVMTDRQVMGELGKVDPNYVRPRINNLLDMGVLVVAANLPDPFADYNGKVRWCKYNPPQDIEIPNEHPPAAD